MTTTEADVRALFATELERAKDKYPHRLQPGKDKDDAEAIVKFGGFNGRKKSLGMCKYTRTGDARFPYRVTVELSRFIVRQKREDIVDTIRHELAHAVAGPKAGHGKRWKEAAVRLGAKPERCVEQEMMNDDEFKWYLIVPESREIVQRYVAQPRRLDMSKLYAKGRKKETLGKLRLVTAEQYRERGTQPL